MTALVPCDIQPIWHHPGDDPTEFLCPQPRPGRVQTIPKPVRDALEVARRSGDSEMQRVAVWLVEGTATEVVQP